MSGLSPAAAKWFEDRGIDPETVIRCGVYTTKREDTGDEAIVFPFLEDGKSVNEKYRGRGKQFWQRTGGKKTFWNADVLRDPALADGSQRLIITEGEIDALSAIEAGYPLTVSVPDGAPVKANDEPIDPENDTGFAYVWNNWDDLAKVKQVVLALDSDPPGLALARELSRRIGPERCLFITYPPGCKDLNDVLANYGPQALRATVDAAKPIPVKGLYRLSDYPQFEEATSYSTGWDRIDEYFRLQLGNFIVVTGVPGHGKSTWVTALVCGLVEAHGWSVAIGSFEAPVTPHQRDDLRRWYLGTDPAESPSSTLLQADRWIEENFLFITQLPEDDESDFDLTDILNLARTAVVRHGIKILVLDPWNEIEHKRRPQETMTEYINRAIREIKRFARRFDVAVIVVAHPTKRDSARAESVPPSLYDISDSAAWYNKADVGIVVWRQDVTDSEVQIQIKKVRRRSIGREGIVYLLFDEKTGRYKISGLRDH